MKRVLLLLSAIIFSSASFGQGEPFVKKLRDLKVGSSTVECYMLFQRYFPEFKSLTEGHGPVLLTKYSDAADETKTYKIEAAYLVNEASRELVTMYFCNGKLYEKSVFWFYDNEQVAEVETKYMKINNAFISNPNLLTREKGTVKHEEEKYEKGAKTYYPVFKNPKKEVMGQTGYDLVFDRESGPHGFWVYAKIFNNQEVELTNDMETPRIEPPQTSFDGLTAYLLPGNEDPK
jgi:hypothetical protein